MQMRDDLGITTKLENGKAYLEFALPEKIGRLPLYRLRSGKVRRANALFFMGNTHQKKRIP